MTINMFEGARRIAKLIAVFIVVGFGIAIVTDSARTVYVSYLVSGQTVVRVDRCPGAGSSESAEPANDSRVLATLCFTARATNDQGPWVAYQNKEVADNFLIPPADESYINRLWWSQTLKNAGMYFLGMLASLAGWWAFTWTVGWIVRGFMSIPRGADSRG